MFNWFGGAIFGIQETGQGTGNARLCVEIMPGRSGRVE